MSISGTRERPGRGRRIRPRTRALIAAWVAGALAVLVGAAPVAADPVPDKGPPPVPAAPTVPSCRVQPSGSTPTKSEFASCLGVTAALDRVPSVGETATLTVVVRASRALPGTVVTVELPKQLNWAQAPAGFVTAQVNSVLPERSGRVATATRTIAVPADRPVTITGVVTAVVEGFGEIAVQATAPDGPSTQAGRDVVFLTVAGAGKPSRLGAVDAGTDQPAVQVTPTAVAARPSWQKPQSVGVAGLPAPTARRADGAALACDTFVTGGWGYFDQNNLFRPSMNTQVQVTDAVNGRLAVGVTDPSGKFNICFDSSVGTRISVTFVTENSVWRVQSGGNPYRWTTEFHNVTPGVTVNVLSRTASDPADYRGLHAFDEANDAWLFIPRPTNKCFDQNDTACRQLKINWTRDSTDGTFYQPGTTNDVHLLADDPNAPMIVVHETGHAVMDDVYNDAFPPASSCDPHPQVMTISSTGCAWVEGWADWFALSVYHDNAFRFPGGVSLDLESPNWSDGLFTGDSVEGRVVGALLDIQDTTNELIWDRASDGFTHLWYTFTHHVDPTFRSFWTSWTADGFDVSDTGALASVYQNTIDYGFREPLADYTTVERPRPTPHNYSFNTNTIFWSVIGVVPSVGSDVDLSVYDDRGQSTRLSGSIAGVDVVDFVAIDSNRRPFGDYYPRVDPFSGNGLYDVELAQGQRTLPPLSSVTVHMPFDLVAVSDAFLTAGMPVTMSVTPSTTQQNPGLFLMGSDPNNPSTWVQSRGAAVASGNSFGPGVAESLTYTPPISGWYGVVITSQHGLGDYTLTRA